MTPYGDIDFSQHCLGKACLLTTASHYLNQCLFIINEVRCHLAEGSFTWIVLDINHYITFKDYIFENTSTSPKRPMNWLSFVEYLKCPLHRVATKTRSVFPEILTKDSPLLAREGAIWDTYSALTSDRCFLSIVMLLHSTTCYVGPSYNATWLPIGMHLRNILLNVAHHKIHTGIYPLNTRLLKAYVASIFLWVRADYYESITCLPITWPLPSPRHQQPPYWLYTVGKSWAPSH